MNLPGVGDSGSLRTHVDDPQFAHATRIPGP